MYAELSVNKIDVSAATSATPPPERPGYQTAINRALREQLASNELETTLRRVVREERRSLSRRRIPDR